MVLTDCGVIMTLLDACTKRYNELLSIGVAEDVALDRTYDAYECAYLGKESHCYDPKDRLFENRLRSIVYQHQAS